MSYRYITLTAFTVVAAACGGTDEAMTDQDYDDIAAATASIVTEDGGEIEGMNDAVDTATGQPPVLLSQSGAGTWTGQRGQIDYAYTFECRDNQGQVQTECSLATEQASLQLSWEGEIETARRYASLERDGSWALSGLTSNVVTFAGTGSYSVDSEFMALERPVMRSFALSYQADYRNVTYDRTMRRPVGGSIQYQVDAGRTEARRFQDVEASFQVTVDVTFASDGTATVIIDGDRSYLITLADGSVVKN